MRNWCLAHPRRTRIAIAPDPMVRAFPQPHCAPLTIGSSRRVSPTVRPMVPVTSKRPRAWPGDSDTATASQIVQSKPSPAEPTNSRCQSKFSATTPASGMLPAPPRPRVALINAMAPPTRSGGSWSLTSPRARGITPAATP